MSVAIDEAICIGTMLNLDIEALLKVPASESDRMGNLWDLIASKYIGVPQDIIFWESPRV